MNVSPDRIQIYEESTAHSLLYSLHAIGKANSGEMDMLSEEGRIFVAEQAVIKEFAKQGQAVFLGHCASEALKEENEVIKVFIRCAQADKKSRIVNEYGIDENEADSVAKRFDKKRANYFFTNTAKQWRDMNSYDVILDSSVIGIEKCADMLAQLITH